MANQTSRRKSLPSHLLIEAMEPRLLLSKSVGHAKVVKPVLWFSHPVGLVNHLVKPDSGGSTTPFGITPAQMRSAYGAGSINFNGTAGDGTGQTIALIDAYDDPNASSDLTAFDSYFGLPNPSFKKLNENGLTSPLPGTDPGGPNNPNGTWEEEESLDIEWAHVMAPAASIILYEAATNLDTAIQSADANSAVTVISMSFGGGQYSGETSQNSTYFSHAGTTYLASTGDSGTPAGEPASLANVVAVGGTTLYLSGSNYSSESGWAGSGGGVDPYDPQPSYQSFTVSAKSTTLRTTPDVSIDADPNTGVPIYDTFDFGAGTPWIYGDEGGTSLASPMWAGLVAVADQGRVLEGLTSLSGVTQTLPRLYQLPASAYHDVTSGNNGLAAGVGYDLVTGIGTPIASTLVPDLAGAATVTGRLFVDNLGNGVYGGTDTALSGRTVYLDENNDGSLDNNEPSATTNASGIYTFSSVPAGGTVRLSTPAIAGYIALPVASASVAYGTTDTINFTYFPTTFSTTTAATNYTLQLDSTGTYDQILINNSLTYSVAKSALSSTALNFILNGTGDSFTASGANGNPIPTGGIVYTGASGGGTLNVIGTPAGNDAFIVTSASISFNGNPLTFANVSLLTLNPGAGTDSLVVNSGSASITAPVPGAGILNRNFSSISIASGASALFLTAATHTDRALIQTSALTLSGRLDLGGNDLALHNGSAGTVNTLLASGYNNGNWNGQGLSSAAAAAVPNHLTALGAIPASIYGAKPFDGYTPNINDILVKWTYYGDSNLDGKVDGTDYARTDNGYLANGAATGWFNGDFNYDTHIDGSDYSLLDNVFNTQGSPL